jgi:hypothetical protein
MNLYLVVGSHDGTGDNLDMVVSAASPAEAYTLWQAHWEDNGEFEKVYLLPSSPGDVAKVHEW